MENNYKLKRFEINKNGRGSYSLGFTIATERYAEFRDFYLYISFGFFVITIVFLRLNIINPKKD